MSNNKQSSIEWLIKQLNQKIDYIPMSQWDEITEIISEAKAMHKEEVVEAVKYGFNKEYFTPNFRYQQELFEQYYNETFGGNNEQ